MVKVHQNKVLSSSEVSDLRHQNKALAETIEERERKSEDVESRNLGLMKEIREMEVMKKRMEEEKESLVASLNEVIKGKS